MKLIIPLRGPELPEIVDTCQTEFERFIKELPKFSNDPILIKLLDDNSENKLELEKIEFSFIIGNDNPEILELSSKKSAFYIEWIEYFLVIEVTLNRVYDDPYFYTITANFYLKRLVLLLNLTFATPIVFLRGLVKIKTEYATETDYLMNSFDFAYEHGNNIKWPSIIGLNLEATLNWFIKFNVNLHSSSTSPSGRAINAFSHLFNYELHETDSSHLFWCLLGIESLFAVGTNNISDQIRQKLQIVLGEPREFKRKLNKLYEFRSRLIHGDLNFPPKFSIDHEHFEAGYWDYVAFATSLLMASLKMLIYNDLDRFEFTYMWNNKSNK